MPVSNEELDSVLSHLMFQMKECSTLLMHMEKIQEFKKDFVIVHDYIGGLQKKIQGLLDLRAQQPSDERDDSCNKIFNSHHAYFDNASLNYKDELTEKVMSHIYPEEYKKMEAEITTVLMKNQRLKEIADNPPTSSRDKEHKEAIKSVISENETYVQELTNKINSKLSELQPGLHFLALEKLIEVCQMYHDLLKDGKLLNKEFQDFYADANKQIDSILKYAEGGKKNEMYENMLFNNANQIVNKAAQAFDNEMSKNESKDAKHDSKDVKHENKDFPVREAVRSSISEVNTILAEQKDKKMDNKSNKDEKNNEAISTFKHK